MNGHKKQHYFNVVKKALFLYTAFYYIFYTFLYISVLFMLIMSFQKIEGIDAGIFVGLANYKRVSTDINIGAAVLNSVLFTIGILIINVTLGV